MDCCGTAASWCFRMTIPSSIHLFNSSGGDEGFQYLYMCGTVFLGILEALRQERAAHPADPQKAADQHASDC